MKLRNTSALVAAIAMAATIQATQASLTSDTLANLVAGNETLAIGDKTFSGFTFTPTGLTSFNAADITVTASQVGDSYLLTWKGDISLSSAVPATADLLLGYTVTANPGVIFAIDQSYTGSGTPANGSYLSVDESVYAGAPLPGNLVAYSHLERGDLSDPPAEAIQGDILTINPPQSTLTVVKDIGFGISAANGGFVTISQVEQSFDQVPEPTTMIAGALLLLPFGASTLRILRKNRAV
jgi:hypothetical protein